MTDTLHSSADMPPAAWYPCGLPKLSPDQMNWFFHHVRRRIPNFCGQGKSPAVPRGIVFTSAASTLGTTLWLRVSSNRELIYGIAGVAEQVAVERSRWAAIVDDAAEQFRRDPPPTRHWVAVIGPAPDQGAATQRTVVLPMRLESPVEIGPMRLNPIRQWITQAYPHPGDRSVAYSVGFWPIEVHGTVSTFYTAGAEDEAAYDLGRLCLLLSLAGDYRWIHWKWPVVGGIDSGGGDLPQHVAEWANRMNQWHLEQQPRLDADPLIIPAWVPNAWSLLQDRAGKTRALDAADSSLGLLAEGRPSAAATQFIALLEQLSGAPANDAKARQKGACRIVAEYLANAHPVADAHRQLAKNMVMYDRRHDTAHAGKRHGSEPRLNMPIRTTTIDGDPAYTYALKVDILRRICRALLVKEFNGAPEDPAPIIQLWQDVDDGVQFILGRI